MIYKTKYFGEIDCDESKLFHFRSGLPGFENEHSFLLIPFEGSSGSMFSLQSAVTPSLSFIVMDPFTLDPGYEPELSDSELRQLGADKWEDLTYGVLCASKTPASMSTVNLRCPIAIHLDTREGKQIVMDSTRYHMRHLLSEFGRQEESASC